MTPEEAHKEALEKAARAICIDNPNLMRCRQDGTQIGPAWQEWADDATKAITAYLAAMEAAGFVVVPVEPTFAMEWAAPGRDQTDTDRSMYAGIYRTMLAARPKVTP